MASKMLLQPSPPLLYIDYLMFLSFSNMAMRIHILEACASWRQDIAH